MNKFKPGDRVYDIRGYYKGVGVVDYVSRNSKVGAIFTKDCETGYPEFHESELELEHIYNSPLMIALRENKDVENEDGTET